MIEEQLRECLLSASFSYKVTLFVANTSLFILHARREGVSLVHWGHVYLGNSVISYLVFSIIGCWYWSDVRKMETIFACKIQLNTYCNTLCQQFKVINDHERIRESYIFNIFISINRVLHLDVVHKRHSFWKSKGNVKLINVRVWKINFKKR